MKTRLFSRTDGKNVIDTFGNVMMFKITLPILTDQQGRKNELEKRL